MKGEPVAKRTRSQTERKLCADVDHMKKLRLEKWEAEEDSSGKQFVDDYAVFSGKLIGNMEGRDHSEPIVGEGCEEDVVFLGIGNGSGFNESDEEEVVVLGVENDLELNEDVIDDAGVTDDEDDDDDDDDIDDDDDDDDDDDEEEEEEEEEEEGEEEEEEEGTDDESLWKGNRKEKGKLRKSPKRERNSVLKHDNVQDDDSDEEEERGTDDESLQKGNRKDKGKLRKSHKRKRNIVLKHDNVQSILLNSILNKEESHSDYSSSGSELTPPEESDSEEESDPLNPIWTEMAFALKASEHDNVQDDDGDEEEERGTDDESLRKGNRKDKGKLRKSPKRKRNIVLKHDNVQDDGDEEEERGTDDESLWKGNRKDKRTLRKSHKRKRNIVLKHDNVQSILLNSILNKEESHSDYSSSGSELTPPEESDSAEESDPLSPIWTEMAFALKASEICSRDTLMAENEATSPHEAETVETTCQRGNHDLILDEEFGLCCKHCDYVKSIRDIDPPFTTSPSRRSEWREYNNVDPSFLDGLHSNDSGFQSQSDYDPFSHAQGTVWDLVPADVRKKMFPHQREGFEFIWNNIAGGIDIEELKNSTSIDGGNGCIISHAPGTGKSGLSLVFLQSYMKLHPRCKPVIIAPRSMLLTWEEEFHKWKIDIPFHNLNKPELSGKENIDAVSLMNSRKHGGRRVKPVRLVKLYSWKKDSGILGVSYRLFDKLVSDDQLGGILLDLPGLFVFDEGHTPRNGDTCMFKALCRIKTKRRIILSGTPFQNNFQELENTLSLVRQEFGEVLLHTVTKRGHKRNEAKRASLISSIGRGADNRDDEKLKELKEQITPFVHVHKGTVLQESLPGLRHTVVVLQPDEFQKSLCKSVEKNKKSFVELDYSVSLISVHPSLFPEQCLESFDVDRARLNRLKLDPKAGIKTRFLLILLELSEAANEKVLVFSQYIEPLTLIMEQLKHSLNWIEGTEVLYMDGKQDVKKRQSSISVFNNPSSEARILLASTKACCEGINLVGASRVVLLDVVWNPFVERQAISRAYRLGQKRVVHVYHLITSGTLEGDKLCRQARKVRWSNKVFSSPDDGGNNPTTAAELLEDKILEEIAQHDNLIKDRIPQSRESELIETFGEFLDK